MGRTEGKKHKTNGLNTPNWIKTRQFAGSPFCKAKLFE